MKANELRIGNYILDDLGQRARVEIISEKCGVQLSTSKHYLDSLDDSHDYENCNGIPLTPERLEMYGFIQAENNFNGLMEEYVLSMPVKGSNKNEIYYYFPHTKQNTTPFGRYAVNGYHGSNNFVYEHELQNIYFSLTGEELKEKIPA